MHDPTVWAEIALAVLVAGAFGWMLWVLNPKHPERRENLRKNFGAKNPK